MHFHYLLKNQLNVVLTKLSLIFLQVAAAVDTADLEEVDSEAATAMVAAAAVVTVAEIATEAMVAAVVAAAEDSVVAAAAAEVVEVAAVTTVIKMVTSHVNAPNKGKSATRSSPPGVQPRLTKGVVPLFEPLPKRYDCCGTYV